jgi:hypothetical protein
MLKQLIKIANELDNRGLVKEADFADKLLIKLALGVPQWMEDAGGYVGDKASGAANWVGDQAQAAAREAGQVADYWGSEGWGGISTALEEGKDIPEVARRGAYGNEAKYWATHGVEGGFKTLVEETGDMILQKLNDRSRERYGDVLNQGGEGLFRFIIGNIPGALGEHTFGGGNKALTWGPNGIAICGYQLADILTGIANANQAVLGFAGLNVLEPAYSELYKAINQNPVILMAVSAMGEYQKLARWAESKTGVWNFDWESLLWGHLTQGLHSVVLPNGVPVIAEIGKYCELVKNPSQQAIVAAATELARSQGIDLAAAKSIIEPRVREWQGILS